ncbi:Rgg/GadR/MutR family transcriptional regulator [Lacticaseibacillus daqingensis]|uniref:Rgg/GadR/MutR family transcriptional regulator n=1 Tax=Lacticaseibacillus daqingensis TaxID=2486014 RepID=UPI0013DE2912|nr:Rgg/GadR/MutR family transcriptional regulator [Lacticaseibacillus daqingensis]
MNQSTPQTYGEFFRQIRTDRHLLMKEVSGDITLGTVSRFEQGKVGISLENFLTLLRNVNMDIEEFFSRYHAQQPNATSQRTEYEFKLQLFRVTLDESDRAAQQMLKDWQIRATQSGTLIDHLRTIIIKAFILDIHNDSSARLTEADSLAVQTYLVRTEVWYDFEFALYIDTIAFLAPAVQADLQRKMMTGFFAKHNTPHSRILFVQALFNTMIASLNARDFTTARQLIALIEVKQLPANAFYLSAQVHLIQLFLAAQERPEKQPALDQFVTALDAISPHFALKERRWLATLVGHADRFTDILARPLTVCSFCYNEASLLRITHSDHASLAVSTNKGVYSCPQPHSPAPLLTPRKLGT